MGVTKYYEFYPPIQDNETDKWKIFLENFVCVFSSVIVETDNKFIIQKGESPSIPKNGKLFRGFSSKISVCPEIENIMDETANILKKIFPGRIFISCDNNCDFVYDYDDPLLKINHTPAIPQSVPDFIKLLELYQKYPARIRGDLEWFRSNC